MINFKVYANKEMEIEKIPFLSEKLDLGLFNKTLELAMGEICRRFDVYLKKADFIFYANEKLRET